MHVVSLMEEGLEGLEGLEGTWSLERVTGPSARAAGQSLRNKSCSSRSSHHASTYAV